MKLKLLGILALMAGSTFAATHFSVGIGIGGGGYYAPAPYYAAPVIVRPPYPGYGYEWVDGYWYYVGPRRVWYPGYWRAPVRFGAVYGPRYYGGYSRGYVGGRYVAPRSYNHGYRR